MKYLNLVLALALTACTATQPSRDAVTDVAAQATSPTMARLVFMRTNDSKLYVLRAASVYVGDDKAGSVAIGRWFQRDVAVGQQRLTVKVWDAPGDCEVIVDAKAGQTYYFMVDPRKEIFTAFVVGDLAATVLGQSVWVATAAGAASAAAESYASECGGLFRLYPVDAATATGLLRDLKAAQDPTVAVTS